MRRSRKVKILATLGPASSEKAKIRSLFEAGADVFRINMSHTDHPRLRAMVGIIREVEADCGRPIGILVDLQGPKLRIGTFAEHAITLETGHAFILDFGDGAASFDPAAAAQRVAEALHAALAAEGLHGEALNLGGEG